MRRTYQKIEQQATDADKTLSEIQKQTKLMRQQLVGSLAATIAMSNPRPDAIDAILLQGIHIHFTNVGEVKSGKFVADGTLARESMPSYRTIGVPEHERVAVQEIPPVHAVPNGVPQSVESIDLPFTGDGISTHDIELLRTMKEVLKVRGSSEYDDGFGDIITQQFCFLYVVPQPASSGGGGWGPCSDWKRVIAREQQQKTQ